jgi:hypothetical protein
MPQSPRTISDNAGRFQRTHCPVVFPRAQPRLKPEDAGLIKDKAGPVAGGLTEVVGARAPCMQHVRRLRRGRSCQELLQILL